MTPVPVEEVAAAAEAPATKHAARARVRETFMVGCLDGGFFLPKLGFVVVVTS